MNCRSRCVLTGLITSALFSASAGAAQIVDFTWFTGIASVAGEPVAAPVALNNDNAVGDSPNPINVWQKDYTGIGVVDLVFDVADTGGTTEYRVSEGVSNSTGLDWSGYRIELGFGTGVDFVSSVAGDGLDFDSPDFDSTVSFTPGPPFFPDLIHNEDELIASGGTMPNGAYAGNFIFHVDVPDGITEFTIRQSPIPVPESSSALLSLAGIAAFGLRRRRS